MAFEQKSEVDEGMRQAGCMLRVGGRVEKKWGVLYRRRSKYKSEVEDRLMCPKNARRPV